MTHRLILTPADTGPGTKPSCSCGWTGLPRSRAHAESQYHAHRNQQENRSAFEDGLKPRPLTPKDQLPEELIHPYHECGKVNTTTEDET